MLATTSITYKFDYTLDPALSPQDRLLAFQTLLRAHPAPADFSDPAFFAILRTYARLLREARTHTLREYAVTIPSEKRRACAKHWADQFETYTVREHTRQQREQKGRDQEDLRINRQRRIAANALTRFRISEGSLATLQARIAKLEQQIRDIQSPPFNHSKSRQSTQHLLPVRETGVAMVASGATAAPRSSIAHEMGERKPNTTSALPAADSAAPAGNPSTPPRQKSLDASAPPALSGSREIASDQSINPDPGTPHPDPTLLLNPDP